jgi:hypothetical protein
MTLLLIGSITRYLLGDPLPPAHGPDGGGAYNGEVPAGQPEDLALR